MNVSVMSKLFNELSKGIFRGFTGIENQLSRNRLVKANTVRRLINFQNKIELLNDELHTYNGKLSEYSENNMKGSQMRVQIKSQIQFTKCKLIIYLSAWSININKKIGIITANTVNRCLGDLLSEEERVLHDAINYLIIKHQAYYIDAIHCDQFLLKCAKINDKKRKEIQYVLKERTKISG